MFCRSCGRKIKDCSNFCSKCGHFNVNYTSNAGNLNAEQLKNEDKLLMPKRKKNKGGILITIIVFVVVIYILYVLFCLAQIMMTQSDTKEVVSQNTSYTVTGFEFTVEADENWTEVVVTEPYDLKLSNEAEDLNFYVMANKKMDLVDDLDCDDLQKLKMDDLMSKIDSPEEVEQSKLVLNNKNKVIYSSLYLGETDYAKVYFYSFGVYLPESEEMLWVLVTGLPSGVLANKDMIEKMVMEIR